MTLPGGPADKLGNRYEKWWTVSECVRMLRGDTEAIRIEDPGVEKAEFVVTVGSRREIHQAKRSHSNGKWSLAALASDGLLQPIGNALAGNDDRFVFVSGSEARELAELCEAARDAESVEEFERVFLAARERKQSFERLLGCYWKCAVPTAIERLRRIEVRTIGERDLEDKVRWGTQALFEPSSSSSRDGITRIVVTRALVSNPPSPSRGAIRTLHETQALNRPLNRGNSNGNTALKRGLQKHLRRSHRSMIRICSPKQG